MKKKLTFRKRSLAIILSLVMGICTLSGCTFGKEPEDPTVVADDSLEVPEVKGKEETVGAFTLLVPKGMSADEQGNESTVKLYDDEDEDKYILIQVVEKDAAKEYVKTLLDEDDNYSEEEFTIADVKWTGASYKKTYALYAKIDKKTIFVTSEGFKPDDDITLAVLASLEIDEDAETVDIGGAGKGGVFTYGDGLFTVEYSGFYREAENSELGDLVANDGSQTVYVTAFADMDSALYEYNELEEYDCDEEIMTVDGYEAYLCTYEDFFGDTAAEFFLPLEYVHENGNYTMVCIYIHTTGDDPASTVNDEFMSLINSVSVDEAYMTDTLIDDGGSSTVSGGGSSSGDVDDWYGTYSGYIMLTGTDAWEDEEYYWDDLYAIVGEGDGGPYFEGYSDSMDLWGGDWSRDGNAVFSFWVELEEDMMTANVVDEAWILDEDDISDASYLWWYASERDYLMFSYDYYDPDYNGGFDVFICLHKD